MWDVMWEYLKATGLIEPKKKNCKDEIRKSKVLTYEQLDVRTRGYNAVFLNASLHAMKIVS